MYPGPPVLNRELVADITETGRPAVDGDVGGGVAVEIAAAHRADGERGGVGRSLTGRIREQGADVVTSGRRPSP